MIIYSWPLSNAFKPENGKLFETTKKRNCIKALAGIVGAEYLAFFCKWR